MVGNGGECGGLGSDGVAITEDVASCVGGTQPQPQLVHILRLGFNARRTP